MTGFTRSAAALAACLVAAGGGVARASAGDGIRVGGTDGRLHPYVDLETRYDSNVTYAGKQLCDLVLHVRPGLELKVPGDVAAFEFSGAIDWAQYGGVEGDTRGLSKWYAEAGMAMLLNRRSPVSVRIDDDFRRSVSTTSLSLATSSAVIVNSNALAVSVPWRPGGGALVLTGRGMWILEAYQPYESGDSSDVSDLSYAEYRGGLDAQWRFLPRTTAVFQGGYFTRVPSAGAAPADGTAGRAAAGARPGDTSGFDLLAGFNGLVTPHVGVSLKGGLGQTFQDAGDTLTWLTDVSGEWLPTDRASVRLGYVHNYGIDPSAAVYASNGLYANGRMRLASRYTGRLSVRWDRLAFGDIAAMDRSGCPVDSTSAACPGEPVRASGAKADFFRVEPGVDAYLTRWMTGTLAYAFSSRANTFPAPLVVPADYQKHEVWLKLGVTY